MTAEGIDYGDENGTPRAHLGSDAPDYPAAVLLFDADGDVIWQAP